MLELIHVKKSPGCISLAIVLCSMLLFVGVQAPAEAKTFKVNSRADINDLSPGNGLCVAYLFINPPFVLPFCTLRGAVEETNNYPGEDIIELRSGIYSFKKEGRDENIALTGDLDVLESLTIIGKGPEQTIIDARGLDRVFEIIGKETVVILKNVTLLHGSVDDEGGAIRNEGILHLDNTVLLSHEVSDQQNGRGGLLYNSGYCSISASTLQNGFAREGGGFFNSRNSEIHIHASTLSNNTAVIGGGGSNYGIVHLVNTTVSENGSGITKHGGGIENQKFLFLQHATVAYNSAAEGGGLGNRSYISLQNSVVTGNIGEDCSVTKQTYSEGYNLDSDGSCALSLPSDISGVDAGLRPLMNYGGNTRTHSLFPHSPARDSGLPVTGIVTDQRGVVRPWGPGVDRGASEYDGFPMIPQLTPLIIR